MLDELPVEPAGGEVVVFLEVQRVGYGGGRAEEAPDAESQAEILEEAEAGAAICLEPTGRAGLCEARELQQVQSSETASMSKRRRETSPSSARAA